MDYFTSTIQDYQPILVGAGCLALGYMYGRHCRSLIENQVDVPTASDAACRVQTDSFNFISNPAAVDTETMAVMRPASCPTESALNYSEREVSEKPERCAKPDLGQLEIFDPHNFHKMPRKKEDMIWAQTAFKKQKGVPVRRESVRTKAEPEQDSDDEILARRLEYCTKSASGTRASINKPRGSEFAKPSKKKKSTVDVTTSCRGKDITTATTTDSQKTLSKGAERSLSGLGALATPHHDQGECSLEDTCRSPKTVCLDSWGAGPDDHGDDDGDSQDDRGCQVELTTDFAPHTETLPVPCTTQQPSTFVAIKCTSSNPLEESYLGDDDMSLEVQDLDSVALMDSQCKLSELPENDSNHTIAKNEARDLQNGPPDARMDDAHHQSPRETIRLHLPTSPPPELHVQDRCVAAEEELREVKEVHRRLPPQVPMDKVLKAEIYELLHAADCGKVSFGEIVSLLEEKLKVVLREDKAHIVSLVREVISISKLLEEEKALEASGQV